MMDLSKHGTDLLMSARRSAAGAVVLGDMEPAAVRELRDNGLVNSHYRLTERGARERAARAGDVDRPPAAPAGLRRCDSVTGDLPVAPVLDRIGYRFLYVSSRAGVPAQDIRVTGSLAGGQFSEADRPHADGEAQ